VEYDPCVGCGFCCLKLPCFAAWCQDWVKHTRCIKLDWDEEANRYWCTAAKSSNLFAKDLYIGEGCTSNLNTWRNDVKDRG